MIFGITLKLEIQRRNSVFGEMHLATLWPQLGKVTPPGVHPAMH